MKASLRILLGVVLLALILSACGTADYNLYGTWRKSDTGATLVFTNNGRIRIGSSGAFQEYDFVFSAPGEITLRSPDQSGGVAEQKIAYTVQGDVLTLTLSTPSQFVRIK